MIGGSSPRKAFKAFLMRSAPATGRFRAFPDRRTFLGTVFLAALSLILYPVKRVLKPLPMLLAYRTFRLHFITLPIPRKDNFDACIRVLDREFELLEDAQVHPLAKSADSLPIV